MLAKHYDIAKTKKSSTNEHVPTFYEYAKECSHITEMGIRRVVSSWGFAYGLLNNKKKEKTFVGVDLKYHPNIDKLKKICGENKITYKFIQGDSAKVTLEQTDLLFIDTWHVYAHLRRELEAQHNSVNKYIMMHDTTIDGEHGETMRLKWDADKQAKSSGYPVEEIKQGLQYAIDEFLEKHPEWVLDKKFTNNNGLTILKKVCL